MNSVVDKIFNKNTSSMISSLKDPTDMFVLVSKCSPYLQYDTIVMQV